MEPQSFIKSLFTIALMLYTHFWGITGALTQKHIDISKNVGNWD